MVLVKHEVPAWTVRENNSSPKVRLAAGTAPGPLPHPSQSELPQLAYETEFQVEPQCINQVPHGLHTRAEKEDYQMQLMLLEQQNIRRLREAAKKRRAVASKEACDGSGMHMPTPQEKTWEVESTKLEFDQDQFSWGPAHTSAASREEYHMQQMALEQENQRRLSGARQGKIFPYAAPQAEYQAPAFSEEKRAAVHTPQVALSGDPCLDGRPEFYRQQLQLLEESNKRRLFAAQAAAAKRQREASMSIPERTQQSAQQHQPPQMKQLAEQSIMMREQAASEGLYPASEDKWGKGPFPAGQGVIAHYQIQLMALDNRQKEEAAKRSQTEVEFSEQRQRYRSEVSEMSTFSSQQLPGTPGTSCNPPGSSQSTAELECGTALDRPLPFRPAPGQSADTDDLYD